MHLLWVDQLDTQLKNMTPEEAERFNALGDHELQAHYLYTQFRRRMESDTTR